MGPKGKYSMAMNGKQTPKDVPSAGVPFIVRLVERLSEGQLSGLSQLEYHIERE